MGQPFENLYGISSLGWASFHKQPIPTIKHTQIIATHSAFNNHWVRVLISSLIQYSGHLCLSAMSFHWLSQPCCSVGCLNRKILPVHWNIHYLKSLIIHYKNQRAST